MSFIPGVQSSNSGQRWERRGERQEASSPQKPPFSADVVVEEAKTWYRVEKQQFGQRLAPAALQNTSIEGHDSLSSVNYWIDVLSCWIDGKGAIIPLDIPKRDLEELRIVLQDYGETLKRYKAVNVDESLAAAEMTLKQIQNGLLSKEAVYTPMGYVGGIQNEGHAIPLKIRKVGKNLECIFLNEGAGVHLHPELNWSETGIRYNFQSFPILFDPNVLLGEKGIELFERQIQLLTKSLDKEEEGYDAYDVYAPFWQLGKVHGGFDKSKIAERAKKPQVGPICADMAITLLIHDFLIDRGIPKKERQRLFLNERLGTNICFLHSLEGSDDLDAWQLFELGIQEFSMRGLNLLGKAISEQELRACHSLVTHLNQQIQARIQLLHPTYFPLPNPMIEDDPPLLDLPKITYDTYLDCSSYTPHLPEEVVLPAIDRLQPEEMGDTLVRWLEATSQMAKAGKERRAAHTLYQLTLLLPIPLDEANATFWSKVASEEIPGILESLHCCACMANKEKNITQLGYIQKTVMFHTYYAIVDFLVRRDPSLKLDGFASPFYFASSLLSIEEEMFAALPLGNLHRKWEEITGYFSMKIEKAPRTLFALDHQYPDIAHGLKLYRNSYNGQVGPNKSLVDHVTYLIQFLEKLDGDEKLSRIEKVKLLWTNPKGIYFSSPFESLFYFATLSWKVAEKFNPSPPSNVIFRKATLEEPTKPKIWYPNFSLPKDESASPQELVKQKEWLDKGVEEKRKLNEIWVSSTPKDLSLTVEEFRAWSEIFSQKEMQVSSTLQWLSLHLEDLSKPPIQSLIVRALFAPGLLPKKLREEPSFLPQCRKVLLEALDYFKQRPIQRLFPSLLGILLETYTDENDRSFLSEIEASLLYATQSEENPSPFYALLLLLYQHAHPQGAASYREHVKAAFWIRYYDPEGEKVNSFDWISNEIPFSLDLPLGRRDFEHYLQDPKWITRTVAETVSLFGLPMDIETRPRCFYQQKAADLGYVLDLNTTTISMVGKPDNPLIRLEMDDGSEAVLAWVTATGRFRVLGQETVLEGEGADLSLKKWFEGEGYPSGWYTRTIFTSNSGFLFSPEHETWKLSDPKKVGTEHILWTREGESTPAYRLKGPSAISFFKRRGREELIGAFPSALSEWHKFFSARKMENELSIWLSPNGTRVEEVDLPTSGLSFRGEEVDGKWRFRSVEYPSYFLAENQAVPLLKTFNGGLLLESGSKKLLLIPDKFPMIESGSFSTHVSLQGKSLFSVDLPYHLFQIDEVEGRLLSDEPASNLFLSYLLALQRNYPKALFYLKRGQDYTYDLPQTLLGAFQLIKDESPEALAFSLRFGLFIYENRRQYLQNSTKQFSISELKDDYYLWIGNLYEQYLRTLSSKQISRIPEYIILSYKEERQILWNLDRLKNIDLRRERKKGDFPKVWRTIFTIRKELLEKQKTSHATPQMQYPTSLPAYKCLPTVDAEEILLSSPPSLVRPIKTLEPYVRITENSLYEHFISLYEKAHEQRCDLDILYLLRSDNTDLFYAYAGLLHYVNRYPGEFATLQFSDDPKENKRTFKQIVAIYAGWKSKLWEKTTSITAQFAQMTPFLYQSTVPLSLPAPPTLSTFPPLLMKMDRITETQQALKGTFVGKYLVEQPSSRTETPFPAILSPQSTTEEELIKEIEEGHHQELSPPSYQLQEGISLKDCLQRAQSLLVERQKALETLQREAEQRANAYPDLEFRIGMRKLARNLPPLTMEGILTKAYETRDPHLIREANPALSPQDIYDLYEMTALFHLIRIQVVQLQQGIKALEKGDISLFGRLLAPLEGFAPIEEPEVFLFCSRTQKLLREEQRKILMWDFMTPTKTKLFAAKAGDGKTTLYQPIAMKRSNRKGLFPISLSPAPLYHVDREGLRASTQQVFDFPLGVAELSLSQQTRPFHLKQFHSELSWIKDEKGLKMTPEHYYALDLKYQLALESEEIESVRSLSQSLQLFESSGNGFVDECRVNLSPFSQAKIGMGKQQSLPKRDVKLFIEIYRTLLIADGQGTIEKNLQATLDQRELAILKEKSLLLLVQSPFLEILEEKRETLLTYWRGEGPRPAWVQLNSPQGWNIEGVRIYFEEFFTSAMSLVGKMRHLPSRKSGEEIHVPAKKGKATTSYFEEIYLTVIATIQGTLQEGLKIPQIKKLLKHLHQMDQEERGKTDSLSSAEELLQTWTKDPSLRLYALPLSNPKVALDLQAKIGKNPETIFWYLQHLVEYPYASEQLSVTPFHFLHAMNQSTLFSADPGPAEIYGIYEKEAIYKDTPFLAKVVIELDKEQNQDVLTYSPPSTPYEFFSTLPKELYNDLTMIIDSGGTLLDFSPKKIAKGFFSFIQEYSLPFDGILFFKEEDLHVWLSDWRKPKILKGNEVKEALASQGLQWESLRLFTYIDPSHTYGANIAQPADARGLLLVGEETSFGDVAQGCLRLREFLHGRQKITRGISAPLVKKIGNGELTSRELLNWTIRNEAARIEKEVLLSAMQQIQYHVESQAREELKKAWEDPKKQIAIWKKYRKGFVTPFNPDLVLRFGMQATSQETRSLLLAFAREKYSLFGYRLSWGRAKELHKLLEAPIQAACRRTPTILSRATRDAHQEVHIHSFQQQEMHQVQEQEQEGIIDLSPVSPENLPEWLTVDSNALLSGLQQLSLPAKKIFHTRHMTQSLYFTENALRTATLKGEEMREEYLKPVSYILLIQKGEKLTAFALSLKEAAFFQKQLVETTKGPQRIALLNVDGTLAQNGKRELAISSETLSSPFVKRVSMEVGLTRCELFHPELFMERLKEWDDFGPMWTKIKEGQPSLKQGRRGLIERLLPKEMKNAPPPKKPEKKKGFFASLFT